MENNFNEMVAVENNELPVEVTTSGGAKPIVGYGLCVLAGIGIKMAWDFASKKIKERKQKKLEEAAAEVVNK